MKSKITTILFALALFAGINRDWSMTAKDIALSIVIVTSLISPFIASEVENALQ